MREKFKPRPVAKVKPKPPFEVFRGINSNEQYQYPMRVLNIRDIIQPTVNVASLSEEVRNFCSPPERYLLQTGDIAISRAGNFKHISYVIVPPGIEAVPSTNLFIIRVNQEIFRPKFVMHYLTYYVDYPFLIDKKFIKNLKIQQLPIDLQDRILDQLRDVENRIKTCNAVKDTIISNTAKLLEISKNNS